MFIFLSEQQDKNQPGKPRPESEKRRWGRIGCVRLKCWDGQVDDFSAGGMRIRSRHRPRLDIGEIVGATLRVPDLELTLPVRVIWSRKAGRGWYEIGVAFEQLTPEQRRGVSYVAQMAGDREIVRPRHAC